MLKFGARMVAPVEVEAALVEVEAAV